MAFTKILGPGIHTLANFHSHNINSSGIITATKFVGDMEPGGGTGSFDSLTVTGNLGVGGTVTYTDVTNIDAVGIITAQSGIYIGAGATVGSFNTTTGISSFKKLNVDETSTLNGSVGIADSIIHIGNTDTSIRFPADDTFAVETAGSEALRITSDGEVGINTTVVPYGNFAVDHGQYGLTRISEYSHLLLQNKNASTTEFWNFAPRDDGSVSIGRGVPASGTGIITDKKFTILSDGLVGVATDNPKKTLNVFAGVGTTELIRLSQPVDSSVQQNFGIGWCSNNNHTWPGALITSQEYDVSDPRRHLLFYTRGLNSDTAPIERLRITYEGDVELYGATAGVTSCFWDASANTLIFNDDVKAAFGNGSDLTIYHDGNNNYIDGNSAAEDHIYIRANVGSDLSSNIHLQAKSGEESIVCRDDEQVELYYNGNQKFRTTETGALVTGEIAASQDYPNFRPVLDFNFAATKKLKPEMTFARVGEASFHDGVGSVKFVSDNEPRFEHDIVTGECKGLMFEQAGTNYSWYSRRFDVTATGSWVKLNSASITADTHTAPDGTSSGVHMADTLTGADGTAFDGNVLRQYVDAGANVKHTFSIYIKLITSTQATIYIRDGATGSTSSANAISNTRNWQRVVVTSSAALTNGTTHAFYIGNTNGTIAVWGSQIERSDYVSSYIKTDTGANGTRTKDNGGVRLDGEDVTDVFNQGEGTLIAEAIPTNSITNQGLVGFYQDFGDVNRIEVRTQGSSGSTANARFESVVGSSSVVTNTSSPHAGINNVSKYAFAFQENNYASTVNGGTVQTDTNGAFPHGTGINSMIIGDSVYSQDASVIIKRIMYYADRLPDSQLVTLTS